MGTLPRRDPHMVLPLSGLAALGLLGVVALCATLVGVVVLRGGLTTVPGASQLYCHDSGDVVRGGTVIDGLFEEPDTLLPMLTNEDYARIVDQALWAPLWYTDNAGVLHAGIADIPSQGNGGISPDLQTWTIRLHQELKWSDKSPLSADDLAFSLQLYADPAFANTVGFPTTAPDDPIGV